MQPTAASATTISGAEVNAQPFSRPGEALEVVPGLIVTQHSGEGKANQYFLRGFNLDHGTDLAIKIDGMPVNMPTHGHGQGYADVDCIVPELIQSVNVRKGPYFADVGDFGSAGSLTIDYINRLPRRLWRPPTGHSAITVGWRQGRRRWVQARCSRLSKASNTMARGMWRTMCARSTASCATARAPRPTALRCRRWPIPTAGIRLIRWRSARSTRASSAASGRSIRPMAARRAGSRCRAIGRSRANTGRARSAPMRSIRRCGSTTISPIFSTIPSTATSSARWTGARSMAPTPATPSMCASAASRRKPE